VIEMEYRGWISVPGLPFDEEAKWEPVIEQLERDAANFGPVIGWDENGAQIVVSTEATDQTSAAREFYDLVIDGLRACGLTDLYPTRVEVEPADDLVPA